MSRRDRHQVFAAVFALICLVVPPALADSADADTQTPASPAPEQSAAASAPAASKARPNREINLEKIDVNMRDYIYEPDPIGGSVVLNLKKMEREPDRRWSLQFSVGAGDANLDQVRSRVQTMEALGRQLFGQFAEQAGAGLFDFGWSDEGASEPNSAFRVRGDVRYRPIPILTLEAEVGRSGTKSYFTQPGFRYDENAEIIDGSIGALVTLPWRVWRFGFYAGGGVGVIRGTLTSQLFVPSFEGVPDFSTSRATGSSQQYNLKGGGEVYVTRFISFTLEAEYRKAEITDLKYDADSEIKAINETDRPLSWVDFEADFESRSSGTIGDPGNPVTLDFSGVLVTGGLRYHF
ncbi:MAG: outer membrane beta-barrel protein [bacterium]